MNEKTAPIKPEDFVPIEAMDINERWLLSQNPITKTYQLSDWNLYFEPQYFETLEEVEAWWDSIK